MRITACLVEDVASVVSTRFDKIRWLGTWVSRITRGDALHDSRDALHNRISAMPGPLTPRDTKVKAQKRGSGAKHRTCTLRRTAIMMIRPLERLSPIKRTTKPTRYGTRRSARSPALLTAVRSRRSGLAVHPRRVLHGPAAPDWRGEIRVGRTRTLTQRSNLSCARSFLRYHLFWATQ